MPDRRQRANQTAVTSPVSQPSTLNSPLPLATPLDVTGSVRSNSPAVPYRSSQGSAELDRLLKLWPFVRPHRRRLIVALVMAAVASGLWAGALLLTFPITKVLMQQQSIGEYVAARIERDQQIAQEHSAKLEAIAADLVRFEADGARDDVAYLKRLQDRSKTQSHLSQAVRDEWWNRQLQHYLVPLLPEDRFQTLAVLFVSLLVVSSLHGVAVYFQEVWIGMVVHRSLRTLRTKLFRTTLNLDAQTLGVEGTPALMARFTNDLTGIAQGLTLLGGKIALEPLKAGTCLASAFAINWRLTLFSLVCAPIGALVFARFGKKLKKASRRQMETIARLYAVIQETLGSFRVVSAYGNARWHRRQLNAESRNYFRKAMQINRIDALVNPTVEMLGVTAACLAILPGAYLVLRGKTSIFGVQLTAAPMDIAELAMLYTLLASVLDPARKLSSVFSKLKKSFAACDRVLDWMNREPLLTLGETSTTTARHQHSIEFDHVTFAYHAAEDAAVREPALQEITLRIEFGDVVAMVGGNGCGKSTLVGMLPRFFDPQQGALRIDGVDVRALSLTSLRNQLGWVPQESLLFNQSIAENIAFGNAHATREQIEDVARRAHVLDFAAPWPEGLDTPVGEKGQRLSGGQRQRVALARAMLRDPAILVLDEATSAIDMQSERLIYEALGPFVRGRTTFIITHAMPVALQALVTKVVVMDEGRVLAVGSHADLLRTCPLYATLAAAQQARRAA